jgi:molecular chaperone GrpE
MSKHHPHHKETSAGPKKPETAEQEQGAEAVSGGTHTVEGNTADRQESTAEGQCIQETIADLQAKLAEANDQFLRKAADFENFRKRMNREKQDAIDFANQSLLLDLIPIIDDFERALKAAPNSGEFAAFYEGVAMIEKRLSSQLETKWGLKRFDSAGEPFDPNRHEAIMMEKSAEVDEPLVKEDFLKGYTLKDRVVRSAKVKVLMPESGAPSEETAEPSVEQAENPTEAGNEQPQGQ